jgi:hypothetical protein
MFEGGFTISVNSRVKISPKPVTHPRERASPPSPYEFNGRPGKDYVTFFGIQNPTRNGSKSYKLIDHYVVGSVGYN